MTTGVDSLFNATHPPSEMARSRYEIPRCDWLLRKKGHSRALTQIDLLPKRQKLVDIFGWPFSDAMSLENRRPTYIIFGIGDDVMIQRFQWLRQNQFNYQFTLMLTRNTVLPQCPENQILDGRKKMAALRNARKLFDQVMSRLGCDLDTFSSWRTSAITRFSLCTTEDGGCPELIVDDDPSTIQYHSITSFRQRFNSPPTLAFINESDLRHVQWLGHFRYVALVDSSYGRCVCKSIQSTETMNHWENEFINLIRLHESPYIVNLVGVVTARHPYSPDGEAVVTAFLLEYGPCGTLKDFITKVDHVRLSKWMLKVAKGLDDMHRLGIVHGDLKPENVIIMESDEPKIIDLAQSGYTRNYHAPEFPDIFETETSWQSSLDIYSFGVVYSVLVSGPDVNLPSTGSDQSSPIISLITRCLAIDPQQRPSAEEIIDTLRNLNQENELGCR